MRNPWSLFGLDLGRFADSAALGLRQLLWGEEAGLRRSLYPSIPLITAGHADGVDLATFGLVIDDANPEEFAALLMPPELTLIKAIRLPVEAELDLASAMTLEATANSPFGEEDTCFGWRLVSRNGDTLDLLLAIASRTSIASFLKGYSGRRPSQLEIWATQDHHILMINGFGESNRAQNYLLTLTSMAKRIALIGLGMLMLISLPAVMLSIRAEQLQEILTATEIEAGEATAARNGLVEAEDRLSAAKGYFVNRMQYDDWLDRIASLTPDSVYFTRLGFDNDRLTVSGMALNAAEYQTILAESNAVADLIAPSAFTRDSRTGKERFTLTMRLDGSSQ